MAEGHVHANFKIDQAELSRAIQAIGIKKIDSINRQIANQARANVPVRSGNLGRTIGMTPAAPTGPFSVRGTVFAGGRQAPYAIPVHEGSRPHIIRARRAPYLRFFWEKVGRNVAFRQVRHPGVKPRPFLRNAAESVVARNAAT